MNSENDQSEKSNHVEQSTTELEYEIVTPLVIEMGKLSRKKLRAFKKGKGALTDEVVGILGEVAGSVVDETDTRTLVPIVMVYEKKPKKRRRVVFPF